MKENGYDIVSATEMQKAEDTLLESVLRDPLNRRFFAAPARPCSAPTQGEETRKKMTVFAKASASSSAGGGDSSSATVLSTDEVLTAQWQSERMKFLDPKGFVTRLVTSADPAESSAEVLKWYTSSSVRIHFPLHMREFRKFAAFKIGSVEDERVFSSAGLLMTDRRTRTNDATFSSLLYLRRNFDAPQQITSPGDSSSSAHASKETLSRASLIPSAAIASRSAGTIGSASLKRMGDVNVSHEIRP